MRTSLEIEARDFLLDLFGAECAAQSRLCRRQYVIRGEHDGESQQRGSREAERVQLAPEHHRERLKDILQCPSDSIRPGKGRRIGGIARQVGQDRDLGIAATGLLVQAYGDAARVQKPPVAPDRW